MEPNDHQHHPFNSYFTTTSTATPTTTTPSPNNGLLPPNNSTTDGGASLLYPHSAGPSSALVTTAPVEPSRKKRGRPRKYGTPEQALAAKKTAAAASSASREKGELAASSSSHTYSGSSKKFQQLAALGNAGQGFTPHVITVSTGEDVAQKIILFMQQSKREMCILSASGSISNAYICQPATSGGGISYEGRFEIISLSGSYVRTDTGGRTGGLSVCLSNADGQIIGGGVGGRLQAAGPVQVIVATFLLDKKDGGADVKGETSASKLPSPTGGGASGFPPAVESSGRSPLRGSTDHRTIGANPFMIQPQGMHMTPSRPTDWRSGLDARTNAGYELMGRTVPGACQSPENGDYERLPD